MKCANAPGASATRLRAFEVSNAAKPRIRASDAFRRPRPGKPFMKQDAPDVLRSRTPNSIVPAPLPAVGYCRTERSAAAHWRGVAAPGGGGGGPPAAAAAAAARRDRVAG